MSGAHNVPFTITSALASEDPALFLALQTYVPASLTEIESNINWPPCASTPYGSLDEPTYRFGVKTNH